MVSTKLALIAIINIAFIAPALTNTDYNGCAILDRRGLCQECFERIRLPLGGCGPALPKSDKCLLYEYDRPNKSYRCSVCKIGYTNKVSLNGTKVIQRCVKGTLNDNCLIETDVRIGPNTERACYACAKDTYSVQDATARIFTCKKITQKVPNCKWGGVYVPKRGKPHCFRCNEGYAVDSKTQQCATAVVTGCWIQEGKKCTACNPFEGYSINGNSTCFKTTSSTAGYKSFQSSNLLGAFNNPGGF